VDGLGRGSPRPGRGGASSRGVASASGRVWDGLTAGACRLHRRPGSTRLVLQPRKTKWVGEAKGRAEKGRAVVCLFQSVLSRIGQRAWTRKERQQAGVARVVQRTPQAAVDAGGGTRPQPPLALDPRYARGISPRSSRGQRGPNSGRVEADAQKRLRRGGTCGGLALVGGAAMLSLRGASTHGGGPRLGTEGDGCDDKDASRMPPPHRGGAARGQQSRDARGRASAPLRPLTPISCRWRCELGPRRAAAALHASAHSCAGAPPGACDTRTDHRRAL